MESLRLKLTPHMLVAVISLVAGGGVTMGVARAQQAETAQKVEEHSQRLDALEKETQASRERILRIEILSEQTNKAVERIERKLDK